MFWMMTFPATYSPETRMFKMPRFCALNTCPGRQLSIAMICGTPPL
jgi:hypothetical protein